MADLTPYEQQAIRELVYARGYMGPTMHFPLLTPTERTRLLAIARGESHV